MKLNFHKKKPLVEESSEVEVPRFDPTEKNDGKFSKEDQKEEEEEEEEE